MTRVHSSAEDGASIPTEIGAARDAFLELIANAYEFTEDVDGEYDHDGRARGWVTYSMRFSAGPLEDLIEALGIKRAIDQTPMIAIYAAIDADTDGPGSAGSGQLSEVL